MGFKTWMETGSNADYVCIAAMVVSFLILLLKLWIEQTT